MHKIIKVMAGIGIAFLILGSGGASLAQLSDNQEEIEFQQYKLYIENFNSKNPAKALDQVIALDPNSAWAGCAILRKAEIRLAKKEDTEAENLVLSILNTGLKEKEDVAGATIAKIARGMENPSAKGIIESLEEEIPIKLEISARLFLAKMYISKKMLGDALTQVDAILGDGMMDMIKIKLKEKQASHFIVFQDSCFPYHEAIRLKHIISLRRKEMYSARKTANMILENSSLYDVCNAAHVLSIEGYKREANDFIDQAIKKINEEKWDNPNIEIFQEAINRLTMLKSCVQRKDRIGI